MRNAVKTNILFSLAVSVVSFIFIITTYIANIQEFNATLFIIIKAGILPTLAILVIVLALTSALHKYSTLIYSIICGILIACLLESSVLSINLPLLDGDIDAYKVTWRIIGNSLVWAIAIVLPVVFRKKLKDKFTLVIIILLVLSISALGDAVFKNKKYFNQQQIALPDINEVLDSVEYNQDNNVIMILLDSVSTTVITDILNNHPEYKEALYGFVNFPNNMGMYPYTVLAVPGLLTGVYKEKGVSYTDYNNSIFLSGSSIFKYYTDKGYAVYSGNSYRAYSHKELKNKKNTQVQSINMGINKLAVFRCIPYYMKGKLLSGMAKATGNTFSQVSDEYVLNKLKNIPVTSEKPTLQYYHLEGGHVPWNMDAMCQRVAHSATYETYYNKSRCSLKSVIDVFEHYKSIGIYDNSVIILVADHGVGDDGVRRPFLMVKPQDSKDEFYSSQKLTSHSMLAPFLRDNLNRKYNTLDVEQGLSQNKRRFKNDIYDADGNIISRIVDKIGIDEVEILTPNIYYHMIPMLSKYIPNLMLKNAFIGWNLMLEHSGGVSEITFKVPKNIKNFSVEFITYSWFAGQFSFFSDNSESIQKYNVDSDMRKVVLNDIIPDKDGVVTIKIEAVAQRNIHFRLSGIRYMRIITKKDTLSALELGREYDLNIAKKYAVGGIVRNIYPSLTTNAIETSRGIQILPGDISKISFKLPKRNTSYILNMESRGSFEITNGENRFNINTRDNYIYVKSDKNRLVTLHIGTKQSLQRAFINKIKFMEADIDVIPNGSKVLGVQNHFNVLKNTKHDIIYHVETLLPEISNMGTVFHVGGWAFDNTLKTIVSSVWVHVDNQFFKCESGERPDIVSWQENDNYLMNGYFCYINTSGMPIGEHEAELIILANNRKLTQKLGEITIQHPDFKQMEQTDHNIRYATDAFPVSENNISTRGWAFDHTNGDRLTSVWISAGDVYEVCTPVQRPDIVKWQKNDNYLWSGFECSIYVEDLSEQNHDVNLIFVENNRYLSVPAGTTKY